MIPTNRAADNYRFGFSFVSPTPSSNPIYSTGTNIFTFVETWGNAFAAGSMGMEIVVTNQDNAPAPNTYRVQAVTPWFSYDSGAVTGWLSGGSYCFLMQGAMLKVNPDCSWTLSFSGLQFTDGVTVLASCGAETMSGTAYDERLNCSSLAPEWFVAYEADGMSCSTVVASSGSWNGACSMTGGYEYGSGYGIQDPVKIDTSSPSGTCTCLASVPAISGSTSYTVSVGVGVQATVTLGTGTGTCEAGCESSTYTYDTRTLAFALRQSSVVVKGRAPNLRSQTVVTSWDCSIDSGPETSGSSSTTTSTVETTCSSNRSVHAIDAFLICDAVPVVCTPPSVCLPPPPNTLCVYDGSAVLSWPTAPACIFPGLALGYDVSLFGEHCVAVSNGSTSDIVLGIADDVFPQTWSFLDTGLSGVWARPRYQDLGSWPVGLFYGDGSNCSWAQSHDNGATWVNSLSMGSGVVGDFDEGADGLRWFFKLVTSGSSFDVYSQVLDSQLNVVRAWTITNVTGVDDAQIACRESPGSDGSWRIGLWFSLGGAAVVKFSPDGLNFS